MQETRVQSLGQEDLLEKKMATHFSILAWEIPWTEEPSELQSVGLQDSDTTSRLNLTTYLNLLMLILQAKVSNHSQRLRIMRVPWIVRPEKNILVKWQLCFYMKSKQNQPWTLDLGKLEYILSCSNGHPHQQRQGQGLDFGTCPYQLSCLVDLHLLQNPCFFCFDCYSVMGLILPQKSRNWSSSV